jgi:murein DD-endopeptidase MepM/ murein hydrolase activator NlpD
LSGLVLLSSNLNKNSSDPSDFNFVEHRVYLEKMKQDYFILVLAHSLHGRLRRVHVPHKVIYGAVAAVLFAGVSLFGLASSYARMVSKVVDYNNLRHEADTLRARYEKLKRSNAQTREQLATLQMFATEVSAAYGVKSRIEGSDNVMAEARLAPTMSETLATFNTLRSFTTAHFDSTFFANGTEDIVGMLSGSWPVEGHITCGYGSRIDPFSGEGAYHTGMDLAAPVGTQVTAAADGTIESAEWSSGYGRLVVIDHGNGYETYYGHLSRMDVMEGQSIRRGEGIGAVGSSGRSTGPHLHYEVRVGGVPINPYRFLSKGNTLQLASTSNHGFGL